LLYDQSRQFEFLITEPVLLVDWVPARVMIPQLHFLATWLDAPNVRIGILPMRAGNVRPWQNSFQMYDELVIVEMFDGESDRSRPELYARVMDEMWARARTGDDARTMLESAAKSWEQGR
jgi:hypothetical protein